jgi:membrane protein DedA with SNARE-associated domain
MNPGWAYLILFLSAFIENIFPPIPGDTVTVIGAYLVGRNILNFWGVFISTTAGSILGFMGIYVFAYWLEWKVIEKYQPDWISKAHIHKVEKWFKKHGMWVILFNRFLSGVRSVISLVAGLLKLQPVWVFVLGLLSCAVWNGGLIYVGSAIGKNWQEIIEFMNLYNRTVLIVLGVILLGYLVTRFIIYRRTKKSSSKP